jgi:hypothetical protein
MVNEIPLKIKDAQEFYTKSRDVFFSDELQLVNLIYETGREDDLSNDSYLHALCFTDMMLRKTSKSFCMLCGSEVDGFLSCLRDSFIRMLDQITRNNGKARIIRVNGKPNELIDRLRQEYKDTLEISEAYTDTQEQEESISHFIACDTRMVRQELPHKKLTGDDPITTIRAKVSFNNPIRAKIVEEKFNGIWNTLK